MSDNNNCCWKGFGRPIVGFVLLLLASWSLVYRFSGNLCRDDYGRRVSVRTVSSINSDYELLNLTRNIRKRQSTYAKADHPSFIVTKEFIRSLFDLWNDALATEDSDKVAQRYAPHATLLPTLSSKVRTDYEGIKDYFDTFLQEKPKGRIRNGIVQLGQDGTWAQDNGMYEFTMGTDGSIVQARYTFIYQLQVNDTDPSLTEWKIVHHHSSILPEG